MELDVTELTVVLEEAELVDEDEVEIAVEDSVEVDVVIDEVRVDKLELEDETVVEMVELVFAV